MKNFHDLTFRGQARRLRPLAMQALRRFGIDPRSLRQLTSATNFVYRVDAEDGERYALRLTSPRSCHTEENIRAEVAWLRAAAAETDLGIPSPVPTPEGECTFTLSSPDVPEEYPCTLFTWVLGRMLADRRTDANVRRHGVLMARLHRHAGTFRLPPQCRVREYRSPFPYSDPADPAFEPIVLLIAGRALLLANFVAASEDADDRAFAPEYLATVESRLRLILRPGHCKGPARCRSRSTR